jgi:hypothetical protein
VDLQFIASPGGDLLWVSSGLPGHFHDKRAEWIGASWTNRSAVILG